MDVLNLPENEMSRRYLRLILRWVPVGMQWYNDWPVRPNCGHFFGGVLWYGQETAMTIAALAVAASSPEYDPKAAGRSADELKGICLKGLRYLCFTHDTGPEDCIRPAESWGRPEPAGTKWGERGRGFFPESQCGRTILNLATVAALIPELIGEEERAMLRTIAEDYMARFEEVPPRAGAYWDTQIEENAWTAEGIAACICLVPDHPRVENWRERMKLWAFRTATMPEDARDVREFADGLTVRELCGCTFTTLPDGTAENHAIVHPSYMSCAVGLMGYAGDLLQVYGHEVPPHFFWRRKEAYVLLKTWADDTGDFHPVQGMDWPYVSYVGFVYTHAVANLYYEDPDAALLERRALDLVERASAAHGGRVVPETTVKHCHGQQDPAIMRERMIVSLATANLAHRMMGEGQAPSDPEDFRRRHKGVHVYPQGGALVHRHDRGITSLAWRNCTMVLPATREGLKHVGPASGSVLGTVKVAGRTDLARQVLLRLRDGDDRACALLVQDLAEGAVRRQAYFASLPDGRCLTHERLTALQDATIEQVRQGHLCVMNDPYFTDAPDGRARLTLHRRSGKEEIEGYAAADSSQDRTIDLSADEWVNVDGRFGVLFRGTGRAEYQNQHHYKVWHAIKDDLVLGLQDEPREVRAGELIGELTLLWLPHQAPEDTARTELAICDAPREVFAARVEGFLCACNFGADAAQPDGGPAIPPHEPVIIPD